MPTRTRVGSRARNRTTARVSARSGKRPDLPIGRRSSTAARQRPGRGLPPRRSHQAKTPAQRLVPGGISPLAILVNRQFEILSIHGPGERFLSGHRHAATPDVLALLRSGLRACVRNAVDEARTTGSAVIVDDAGAIRGVGSEAVRLTVIPARRGDDRSLLVFENESRAEHLRPGEKGLRGRIQRLKISCRELRNSQGKLQSVNAELNAVNQALRERVENLESVNADINSLLVCSETAMLCLDSELHIKCFSPSAGRLLNVTASDVGCPADRRAPVLMGDSLRADVLTVLEGRTATETEFALEDGRRYIRRILPCSTQNACAGGLVVTFTDITEMRNAADQMLAAHVALAESLEQRVAERTLQLRTVMFELAILEERERRMIAVDLHDGLAQLLAIANLKLSGLPEGGDEVAPDRDLRDARELVAEAERTARSLIFQISPPVLFELGFVPALEWLAEELHRMYGLVVEVHDESESTPLDQTVRSVLFRCVRELLVNVARHAQVHAADVGIHRAGGQFVVSVADAGIGFDPSTIGKGSSPNAFGLVSVRERVGFVGGTMEIDSVPGDGTMISLAVPLQGQCGMLDRVSP